MHDHVLHEWTQIALTGLAVHHWRMFNSDGLSLFLNARHGVPGVTVLSAKGFERAKAAITRWPGYTPTPLRALTGIPGVGAVYIKDESSRFGLGSFKALGGAYAVANILTSVLSRRGIALSDGLDEIADGHFADLTEAITVTCATDGNHGRSVAWGAARFHCRCAVFVHEAVSRGRIEAIAGFGAEVVRVAGNYDDAVREADHQARSRGWFVVSDTSYPGYTEVPRDVMQGYRLMADEAADQWPGAPPTHVFIQAGVGGGAAAVSIQMRARFKPAPLLIIVEPEHAACLLASAKAGGPTTVQGNLQTIMAGLACGELSLLAWHELERAAFAFASITDEAAVSSLRFLSQAGLEIGESGAAGLAGLLLVLTQTAAREALQVSNESRVLLFGTEGITDVHVYDGILQRSRR